MSDLPAVGSVWRKGDHEFLRVERIQRIDPFPLIVAYLGSKDYMSVEDWLDWSRGAVCVYDPTKDVVQQTSEPTPGTVRIPAFVHPNGWVTAGNSDESVDDLAERLKEEDFDVDWLTQPQYIEFTPIVPTIPTVTGTVTPVKGPTE